MKMTNKLKIKNSNLRPSKASMPHNRSITISELSKRYANSKSDALTDVNLDILEGEVFGLLGPNGAGKTTLFSILCGLLSNIDGEVKIYGKSLAKELESIKKIVGVVPQDIALYPTLSGYENLMYIGRMYGLKGPELKSRVHSYLDLFDFGDKRNELVSNYSGGMKRKINLIGGILHKPSLLLLDEPTVGMDVQTRLVMMKFLKQLNTDEKMTILYTSHYMEQAQFFCDRVAIIDQGRILKMDAPDSLIKDEACKDLEEVFVKLTGRKILD